MDYIKQNHLSILIIVFLVVSSFLGGNMRLGAAEPANVTVFTNPLRFDGGIRASSTVQITGASTLYSSLITSGAFTQGGGVTATSSTKSTTFLASEFDTESVVSMTTNTPSLTFTLPASSTLSAMIPTAGQSRVVYFDNATTTAGQFLSIAGNTGTLLRVASTTALAAGASSPKQIPSESSGKITFVRLTNTDIEALMDVYASSTPN